MLRVRSLAQPNELAEWSELIAQSTNGTWLHSPNFLLWAAKSPTMFLVAENSQGRVVGGIAGTVLGRTFISHPNATFGGYVFQGRQDLELLVDGIRSIDGYLSQIGCTAISLRPTPEILRPNAGQEDLYAYFQAGYKLEGVAPNTWINRENLELNANRRRSIKRAEKAELVVVTLSEVHDFHRLLVENLHRHGKEPVHSVDELTHLLEEFAAYVRLTGTYSAEGTLLAGILTFEFPGATHTQYMASSHEGRRVGALDLSLESLIDSLAENQRVTLGISSDDHLGLHPNYGLLSYKRSWGARVFVNLTLSKDLVGVA